ncbi:MAG: hypothetical protein H6740_28370 [Alphaproteobacteria bacterium]|nr:hypothetical protein [Alphaproteobacteria bacterium]
MQPKDGRLNLAVVARPLGLLMAAGHRHAGHGRRGPGDGPLHGASHMGISAIMVALLAARCSPWPR